MERFENLLDFINELNENGRIQYDDYSRLFDLVQEFAGAEEAINAAATDIAALLWRTRSGVSVTSVGRMASCASCAPALVLYVRGLPGWYSGP